MAVEDALRALRLLDKQCNSPVNVCGAVLEGPPVMKPAHIQKTSALSPSVKYILIKGTIRCLGAGEVEYEIMAPPIEYFFLL